MKRLFIATAVGLGLAFLSGCASTNTDARAQVSHADERVLGYFNVDGDYSRTKTANGYERKLFGTTRQKQWVLQDFYASNGQAQTSAFTVFDERGLYDWSTLQFSHGPVVFYYADGKKQSRIVMNNGVTTGQREVYYRSGELFQSQKFDDTGHLLEELFFNTNGKRLLAISYDPINNEQSGMWFYDEAGKEQVPSAENRDLMQSVVEKIQRTHEELERAAAELAGQPIPAAATAVAATHHPH